VACSGIAVACTKFFTTFTVRQRDVLNQLPEIKTQPNAPPSDHQQEASPVSPSISFQHQGVSRFSSVSVKKSLRLIPCAFGGKNYRSAKEGKVQLILLSFSFLS
jgi:hypothetical protein